jgi:predicted nucleic acid-binding protein
VIVVSDASPVTSLAAVGQLALLERLYGAVVIPEAVYRELIDPPGQPGSVEVQSLTWITVRTANDRSRVTSLLSKLDPGEAEAIALALELQPALLLIDERHGREIAEGLGLRLVGTLGILLAAKQHRYLAAVKPVLDELIDKARFRVSPALYRAVLSAADESESG